MGSSSRAKLVNTALRFTLKPLLSVIPINDKTFFYTRLTITGLSKIVPPNLLASIVPFHIDDIPCEWVQTNTYETGKNECTRVILYLHGGAYIVGSPQTHRQITTNLAHLTGSRCLVLDYRQGPDHRFPAAHKDALKAYKWLLAQGYDPKNIAFAGDSAGGNLCIGLTKMIKEEGLEPPACMALMSPWTNMTGTFDSVEKNARKDPYLPACRLVEAAKLYAGEQPLKSEILSPVFSDLSDMPPTMIHCSSIEVVRDDGIEYAKKAKKDGSEVHLEVFEGLSHVWQFFYFYLPEGRDSMVKLSKFMVSKWKN